MKTYTSERLGQVTIPEDETDPALGCPSCEETRIEWLEWQSPFDYEDDVLRCATCGVVYNPWKAFQRSIVYK